METETYIVPEEWAGKRLDQFLASREDTHSRGYIQKLIEKKLISIDKRILKPSSIIKAGDRVYVRNLTFQPFPKAEHAPLDIVYEDEDILVVNKPYNMVVHPTNEEGKGTLVQALLFHSKRIADAVYDTDSLISRMRPGIVHRLDKDTSGLIVVAKTKTALHHLANQFKDHLVEKEYLALVYGAVSDPSTIHTNLLRKPSRKNVMGVSHDEEKGREAITHLQPVQRFFIPNTEKEVTLLKCSIETGRTHQIRVHCKHSGHPILGDPLYTTKPARALSLELDIQRQLLHAAKLSFEHPRTKDRRSFESPLPADFQQVLTKLVAT